ncbi:hypothetical protein PICMEDRAFT_74270 [Pichia membranifaciens NRRL Y-2026]|uniref:Helicase SWR1 n=1 Tax=Pichia membranifaciens NRRL Y-2026 TaxID=763406 RepID=A0A1E3NEG0_9ASCO|nr:hypothetical protein PICMEDRAFT_74270 [Pichia membranifaciens NRRL Y-2026]ODQ44537.1 hypothetical protein PICMEDRAFT_74270 [Pichia membranifaciens NRRL Y-2026]
MSNILSSTELKLLDLLTDSNILIDELYHLQNFQSITNYNPNPDNIILNKDSQSFVNFKNDLNLDIWPQPGKRLTRRISVDQNNVATKLKNKLSGLLDSRIKERLELQSNDKNIVKHDQNGKKRRSELNSVSKSPKKLKLSKMINLNLTVKPQIVTHPSHIPTHSFASIDDLFASYRNVIEDPTPEMDAKDFEEYIKAQSLLVDKIKDAVNNKHLLYIDFNENIFKNVPSGMREPTMIKRNQNYNLNYYKPTETPFRMKNDLTHYDHLLAQGTKSSKLIHDLRTTKIQKCKRIAQMIEVHFKRLSQEKDKQEKEYKKKITRLARETAKEVKKKWLIAVKAYKILEERERERERLLKSKEQLSKILDHSTKVLGAQLVGKTSNNNSSVEPEKNSAPETDESTTGTSNDEMSSSSDSEAEEDNETNVTDNATIPSHKEEEDDNKLSLEALKEKYSFLDRSESQAADIVKLDHSAHSAHSAQSLSSLYNEKEEATIESKSCMIDQLDENERAKMLSNSLDVNSVLSDESNSLSDSDIDSSSMSDFGSDSELENVPNLRSLFSNNNISDSDDDESVYSDNAGTETPSSSPEHTAETAVGTDDDGIPDVTTPALLKGQLRPYQKQGLNWLASLYNNGTNGILADEMGLGKTIQTISLLSYLACEKNVWGPHLIVVPTSVMLNWEMEFKRFAPGFKVLTYYGSPQQRKEKRKGWNTPDTFHVCITSYQLVVHDQPIFRRKKWKYMILDEAHNIKNFKSQRWKALLNFNTEHRVLLTGTPLQNNIIELWSLLYFLMPSSKEGGITMPEGFADLMDFQQWFGKPVDKIIQQGGDDKETRETVNKLHQVLRPYLLRRLKQDVEKQMPAKHEHIVYCRLSKRQRLLYDDFMSRAQTKETLASGNFLSIINCLMQLRKVCNHPDLFEVRPILTSFAQDKSVASNFELQNHVVRGLLKQNSQEIVDKSFINLISGLKRFDLETSYHLKTIKALNASNIFENKIDELEKKVEGKILEPNFNDLQVYYEYVLNKENTDLLEMMRHRKYVNDFNCNKTQLISSSVIDILTLRKPRNHLIQLQRLSLVKSVDTRCSLMKEILEKYAFVTPKAVCNNMNDLLYPTDLQQELRHDSQTNIIENPFHQIQVKSSIAFPDKSLLQYDCGKLQKLAQLLHNLIPQGHRVLIFTQMSKVLDILELFLNYHGYTYMRLDGATRIEDRQLLTERFNNDSRVKCFILSTRAGGLGINLTGADTVIFYDSDWNPAIDKQCQDRCHRIGQTRDVHIYRFVSEYTIEANILKKAEQKKHLDNVVIQKGDFTTDYFSKLTVNELLGKETENIETDVENSAKSNGTILRKGQDFTKALEMAEDAEDAKAAEIAMRESNVDVEDFSDSEKNTSSSVTETSEFKADSGNQNSNTEGVEVETLARRIVARKEIRTYKDDVKQPNGKSHDPDAVANEEDYSKMDNPDTEAENKHCEKANEEREGGENDGDEKGGENESDDGEDDGEEDDEIGHIDEYMIRFIAGGYYFD